MTHVTRFLGTVALFAIATTGPAIRAADQVKPRVRAITGFVSIDATSYPSQLQDTVTFLSSVRAAVKAAGYDVAGIRISTQPFPEYTRGLGRAEALALLRRINDLAATLQFAPNIGPAMVKDTDDTASVDLVTDVLSEPGNRLNANIVVAGDDGIHWNAVRQAARIIKGVGERSPHGQGNFNFGAIAMLKPYGPFYPGAWHPGTGPRSFAIGLEAANVVMDVFARERDPRTAGKALTDALAVHARAVEAAAMKAAAGSGWTYAGIDPTPAPGGRASIGAAIESFTGEPFGAPGTETASGIITRAVKDVPVKQTGYSGLMIPVLEDAVLTRRWTERTYGLDSILAYSAVCAGGVDTVPLAGDTSEATIARIVGDVATLAFKWNKPLAARLLPAPGRKAGEMTEFSGALSNAIIQPMPGAQVTRDPIVREGATTRIGPHVYVIPDDDVPLVPNVGIIVGSRATLVVDTGLGPRSGEAVAREVAKVSRNTELYLAVTHVHPEHDLGAQAFPPTTKMLRSRGQDADIAEFGLQLADTFASQSPVRAQLLKGAAYRKTDIVFDQEYTLDLGGVRVRMEAVGPTHTRGDTVFFVEGDATLFAGDVVMSAFPAFASPYSSVRAWLAALDRLEAMTPKVIVPSHGRLVDTQAVAKYREYLREVQSRTQALKQQGKSADEAAQLVQTELQARFADMAQPARIAGAAKAAYQEAAASAQPPPVTIVLTGQSMIRSDLRTTKPAALPAIKGLLNGDVVLTNLEAAVAEPGETIQEGRGFLTPPEALDALTAMGFNLLALSGNHAFDLRETGIRNTLRETDRRHIAHAGTGNTIAEASAPTYLQTSKGTIALVASASGLIGSGARATAERPGVNELRVLAGDLDNEATADLPGAASNTPNPEDSRRILQSIREARQRADLVIVYQHNHVFANRSFSTMFTEGMPERLAPNPWLVKWTHDEIDAGADIVVMHGAPLLHGVEIYRGRPILYDLGNFIYNVPPTLTYIDEPMAWESVVATVQFQARSLASLAFRPVVLNTIGDGQPDAHSEYASNPFLHTRGLPSPATGARAGYILQRLADASTPFGTTMEIRGATATVVLTGR